MQEQKLFKYTYGICTRNGIKICPFYLFFIILYQSMSMQTRSGFCIIHIFHSQIWQDMLFNYFNISFLLCEISMLLRRHVSNFFSWRYWMYAISRPCALIKILVFKMFYYCDTTLAHTHPSNSLARFHHLSENLHLHLHLNSFNILKTWQGSTHIEGILSVMISSNNNNWLL